MFLHTCCRQQLPANLAERLSCPTNTRSRAKNRQNWDWSPGLLFLVLCSISCYPHSWDVDWNLVKLFLPVRFQVSLQRRCPLQPTATHCRGESHRHGYISPAAHSIHSSLCSRLQIFPWPTGKTMQLRGGLSAPSRNTDELASDAQWPSVKWDPGHLVGKISILWEGPD